MFLSSWKTLRNQQKRRIVSITAQKTPQSTQQVSIRLHFISIVYLATSPSSYFRKKELEIPFNVQP